MLKPRLPCFGWTKSDDCTIVQPIMHIYILCGRIAREGRAGELVEFGGRAGNGGMVFKCLDDEYTR